MLIKIYSPNGELFEVPKSRLLGLVAQGWHTSKPVAPKVQELRVKAPKPVTTVKVDNDTEEE